MITPLQYNDIPWLVILFFSLLYITIYAMHHGGLFSRLAEWVRNVKNERTFNDSLSTTVWGVIVFTVDYMFLFGLLLFCATGDNVPALLARPAPDTLIRLGLCMLPGLGWFLFHWFCFHWTGYLFGIGGKVTVFNRVYLSVYALSMPFALMIFLALFLFPVSSHVLLILLSALFILTQIVCIFNGFRIFMDDFASGFVIFVYLCTLEIAPLVYLYAKYKGVA